MARTVFASQQRRRRSPVSLILWLVLIGIVAFLVYLGARKTDEPARLIEQDVTNDVLAH
jgi:hypothetical protein